jgi:hypothetical protein
MICDKSFKDDSLVSFAKEADTRSKQISNVAYKLLIRLGTTQEQGFQGCFEASFFLNDGKKDLYLDF